jgi:transcriptional regulator with XRE-family HTH domain
MEIIISEILKNLRKGKGISQEVLAETMGISVQAVSKWENNLSYPDIELLPKITEYYNVTLDYLLTGNKKTVKDENVEISKDTMQNNDFPNDNILRIVQYKGNQMLSKNTYDPNIRIMLEIKDNNISQVEIWGSADIKGDIGGNVNAGDGINCGNIGLSANAGDGINCGNIGGEVTAGDGVNCGNVEGKVTAGDGVNCGNIIGNVIAGDSIKCANIEGDVHQCEGDIHCTHIAGDVHCEGDIHYKSK